MKQVSLIFAQGWDKQTNISERICFALWMNIYFDIILFRIPLNKYRLLKIKLESNFENIFLIIGAKYRIFVCVLSENSCDFFDSGFVHDWLILESEMSE